MDPLQETLEEALKKVMSDATLEDVEILPNGHLCGHVISAEFSEMDHVERRAKLREAIDRLKEEDRIRISTLLTFSPDEYNVELKEQ